MSEAGLELFNRAFPIVVELLYAVCLTLFLLPFLGERRGKKPPPCLRDICSSLWFGILSRPHRVHSR